jgi:hypothetical protein
MGISWTMEYWDEHLIHFRTPEVISSFSHDWQSLGVGIFPESASLAQ